MHDVLGPKISTSIYPDRGKTADAVPKTRSKVNVLWTGGFDSTFRILQLSKLNVDIQPYYVYDKRKSETYELDAIKAIKEDILAHPGTKASLMPLLRVKSADIAPDHELTEAYFRLNKEYSIGIQYDWLGRFSRYVPGIELVVEKGISSKFYKCLMERAWLVKIENDYTSYFIADKDKSDKDFICVFGNFRFPNQILHLTKVEIAALYTELGFEHTRNKTWFCHNPINNSPCGMCNPCKSVIEEGLSFRMSKKALKRYQLSVRYNRHPWFKYYLKMDRILTGLL